MAELDIARIAARNEIPEYVNDLPIISATPAPVSEILIDLIKNPVKRKEIGKRSREFAVKWHSNCEGAKMLNMIYKKLI